MRSIDYGQEESNASAPKLRVSRVCMHSWQMHVVSIEIRQHVNVTFKMLATVHVRVGRVPSETQSTLAEVDHDWWLAVVPVWLR